MRGLRVRGDFQVGEGGVHILNWGEENFLF